MTATRVGVMVAARNASATVVRALESLCRQSFTNWRAVVVDDASTDDTVSVARSVADSRIDVIRSDEPIGRAAARNLAARHLECDLLAVQDADDGSLPDRLERSVAHMDGASEALWVAGQPRYITPRGRTWSGPRLPAAGADPNQLLQLGVMAVCHPASMIRAAAFHSVGGYDEFLLRAQDLNLAMRLSRLGRVDALDDEFVLYEHRRLLPFRYWVEARRYRLLAQARAAGDLDWRRTFSPYVPERHPLESLAYPLAMARRLWEVAA